MNRTDLRRLAEERIEEAELLLRGKKPSGSYYLSGYAVEFALKACVARLTKEDDFYDKTIARDCFTHRPDTLVKLAQIRPQLDVAMAADPDLAANWAAVCAWNESSRYEFHTEAEAEDILRAITDPDHGVLSWIRTHW